MNQTEVYRLAEAVARELSDARDAYQGQKWKMVGGREKAVAFQIEAPSLAGVKLKDVTGCINDFNFMVYEAKEPSARHRLTYLFHCDELLVSNDGQTYTGSVVIRERDFDWQT